jgi:hypothetical protein
MVVEDTAVSSPEMDISPWFRFLQLDLFGASIVEYVILVGVVFVCFVIVPISKYIVSACLWFE